MYIINSSTREEEEEKEGRMGGEEARGFMNEREGPN